MVLVLVVVVVDDARGTPILYQVISDDDYDGYDCRVVIAGLGCTDIYGRKL